MQFISGSVTKAKEAKKDAEYSKVTDTTHKTTLEEKYTAATALLEDGSKLKNLDASSNLDTTKATLESAKTALDAAVAAVKPDLDFQKTKTSAAAKVTELESLVNTALKDELQRQVNELTKEQAAQATTMLENLTSLKESLESLQTLVSDGLKMQVDYPQKYYDADNKEAFDAALLKASSVFPAFQWTEDSIVVPAPEGDALPNPRAWTKARDKSEFKLQNFVMAPTQAAAPTPTEPVPAAAASAAVRVAMSEEAETQPAAPTPAADLASTASYLKSLNDTLKAATDALNGDNPTEKTAYYKPVDGRTLYWDGFMPKIVLDNFDSSWAQNSENERKIRDWFREASNWAGLSDQLTKKLGAERFKNVVLSNPQIIFEDVRLLTSGSVKFPKVTFTVAAKDGYQLASGEGTTTTLELKIRVLYSSSDPNALLLPYQGASPSAAPSNSSVDDANVKAKVNVYLNYTGPAIMLNADLPTVGGQENTSINGTSNVNGDFNTKSKELLVRDNAQTSLFQAVMNYVNKFDVKYPANPISEQKNGVTWAKLDNNALRVANLDDAEPVYLQQVNQDTNAVYFAVNGVGNNKWLNTFLIRIPLTKFVKPLTEFRPTTPTRPSSDTQQQGTAQTQSNQGS
ncbi:hypothetical protein [Mycoplasmopsis synoviae]|uniref:hypothetical protein n=1 Tax=Mycoplasmopsis synoviae TaxID=2109 RepID=UPI000615B20B|nr:hypothetical protein [Mycoplasmopsis synoviae]AKB11009.1 lipoprotein [Mycoplasmopsis synoviae ATCC 25204]